MIGTSGLFGFAVALLSVTSDGADIKPVETVTLRGNEVYPIQVRRELTVLRFPFRCSVSWVSSKGNLGVDLSDKGTGLVHVAVSADAPIGTSVDATLLCDSSLVITLNMTVAETERTSPRIDFVWSKEDLSLNQQRHQTEMADLKASYEKLVQDAMDSRQPDIQYILALAKNTFDHKQRRDSGRSGSVSVHVDHEKRLGDLGIIEFRVVNRERTPVRINRIDVAGAGSSSGTTSFTVDEGPFDAIATQNSVGGVRLSDPLVLPGATQDISVAFPWPGDTTRFRLLVHLNAPDARDVEVHNVDF